MKDAASAGSGEEKGKGFPGRVVDGAMQKRKGICLGTVRPGQAPLGSVSCYIFRDNYPSIRAIDSTGSTISRHGEISCAIFIITPCVTACVCSSPASYGR